MALSIAGTRPHGEKLVDAAAPLLTSEDLAALVGEHERRDAAVTVLTVTPDRPLPYGRIVRDAEGWVVAIVEEKDATAEQRAIRELNSSIYVFEAAQLWESLEKLDAQNAQGELYLTDTITHIVAGGRPRSRLGLSRAPRRRSGSTRESTSRSQEPLTRPDQRGAHAGGRRPSSTRRAPGSTPTSASRSTRRSIRSRCSGGRRPSPPGAQIGPHVVAVDSRDRGRCAGRDRSVTFAPEPFSTRGRRRARSWK